MPFIHYFVICLICLDRIDVDVEAKVKIKKFNMHLSVTIRFAISRLRSRYYTDCVLSGYGNELFFGEKER